MTLKKIPNKSGKSTKDAVICGMRQQSQLGNQVLFSRANRRTHIDEFLGSANEDEKRQFLTDFDNIVSMLIIYATVSERLLVFIDNNVLQDVAKRESEPKRRQRFCSLLAALSFAQDYCLLNVVACISPAILFEACGKKPDISVPDANALVARIALDIAQVGLSTHFAGFGNASQLPELFKEIQADEKQISEAIEKVASRSWNSDFSGSFGGTRIPLSLADQECPDIHLSYFDPWFVKFLIVHMIEKRLYQDNKHHAKARRMMVYGPKTTFSVLKKRPRDVEGLGDIELMTHCDLTTQTMNNSPQITMALTFDERLLDTLMERAKVGELGPSFKGGSPDAADFARTFAWSMRYNARRNKKENEKLQRFLDDKIEFENEILMPHFRKLGDSPLESTQV